MNVNITNTYDYQSIYQEMLSAPDQSTKIEKSTAEMTLEEYKNYIDGKIARIPFHPSHRRITEYLTISEEGYIAMKNDPEYEEWVLSHIRENRSVDMSFMTCRSDFLSGTDYEFIGAEKEKCRGESYNNWDRRGKKREEKEAEVKRERERRLRKARKKAMDKQYFLKQQEIKALYDQMAEKRREYSRYLNESSLNRKDAKRPKSINVRAVKTYESSFNLDIRREMNGL